MFTRVFERESVIGIETINMSEYGFEYYIDNELERAGLVDGLDETVEMLLEDGFEEIL